VNGKFKMSDKKTPARQGQIKRRKGKRGNKKKGGKAELFKSRKLEKGLAISQREAGRNEKRNRRDSGEKCVRQGGAGRA